MARSHPWWSRVRQETALASPYLVNQKPGQLVDELQGIEEVLDHLRYEVASVRIVRRIVVFVCLALTTSCGFLGAVQTSAPPAVSIEGRPSLPPAVGQPDEPGLASPSGDDRLTPLLPSEASAAIAVIETVHVQGRGPKTGYRRDLFGEAWDDGAAGVLWSGNGCRTRDDILARDLDQIVKRDTCVVVSGEYQDPYTGAPMLFSKARAEYSPIDHVVPISFAWQMGANSWPADKRLQFANDPLNLVLTSKTANSAKGDSDPASWLPPNKPVRCAYVLRFTQVALKYSMPVTAADQQIMLAQCAGSQG